MPTVPHPSEMSWRQRHHEEFELYDLALEMIPADACHGSIAAF